MNRYKTLVGLRDVSEERIVNGENVLVYDVHGVTPAHMKLCASILEGEYDAQGNAVKLPHPMTGAEVRGKLGCLWGGCSLA